MKRLVCCCLLTALVFTPIQAQQPEGSGSSGPVERLANLLDSLRHEVEALQRQHLRLSGSLQEQQDAFQRTITDMRAKWQTDSLHWAAEQSALQRQLVALASDSLQRLHAGQDQLGQRVGDVDRKTSRNSVTTWGITAALLALLATVFFLLRRKTGNLFGRLKGELKEDQRAMEERMVKLDADLIKVLEKHPIPVPVQTAPAEADHSLALKVADEITRIEQNLAQMDTAVRGHKQLAAAVKRMHENLQAAGYQLPALLDKPYDEGMKVTAAFVTDDKFEKDQRIITRVFKPTVLHNGRMIQAGDVQVTQG